MVPFLSARHRMLLLCATSKLLTQCYGDPRVLGPPGAPLSIVVRNYNGHYLINMPGSVVRLLRRHTAHSVHAVAHLYGNLYHAWEYAEDFFVQFNPDIVAALRITTVVVREVPFASQSGERDGRFGVPPHGLFDSVTKVIIDPIPARQSYCRQITLFRYARTVFVKTSKTSCDNDAEVLSWIKLASESATVSFANWDMTLDGTLPVEPERLGRIGGLRLIVKSRMQENEPTPEQIGNILYAMERASYVRIIADARYPNCERATNRLMERWHKSPMYGIVPVSIRVIPKPVSV